ncbi:uncharacterized protein HaLaN_00102 [Haematococcus lacustris]|uniref:Uncharacterized protein n=1 Tax=Haematococcus lacustris TaxID=44745 RepID=A0A699Y5V9_HAELA|nr:uncharacterized protein HaLaN_00102 [Haematococcus lacustris]
MGLYSRVETQPGLDAFAHDPLGLESRSLQPLLAWARAVVPPRLASCTPLFLLATAGMRKQSPAEQHAIMGKVTFYGTQPDTNTFDRGVAQLLLVSAWRVPGAAKYLEQEASDTQATLALLDSPPPTPRPLPASPAAQATALHPLLPPSGSRRQQGLIRLEAAAGRAAKKLLNQTGETGQPQPMMTLHHPCLQSAQRLCSMPWAEVERQLGHHANVERYCLWAHYVIALLGPQGLGLQPGQVLLGKCP